METGFALLAIALVVGMVGFLLQWLELKLTQNRDALNQWVHQINDCLPQLQCGECGYPGCLPYAQAIAQGEIGIDHCPPGGTGTAQRLATLLGQETPIIPLTEVKIAVIEDHCVGCALCLSVCPTDAIIGSPRHQHVVINDACVGCGLCLPPCPVDCIRLIPERSHAAVASV